MDTAKLQHLFWITFLLSISSVDNCGHVIDLNCRIIGGEPVRNKAYPWFAALAPKFNEFEDLYTFCGGSLITKKEVILAAHCLANRSEVDIIQGVAVYFGVQNICSQWRQGERVSIQKYLLHPNYRPNELWNDIAIVTLEKEINYEPICLPQRRNMLSKLANFIFPGQLPRSGEVIGFGVSNFHHNIPITYCQLQHITVPTYSREICDKILARIGGVQDGAFCAGDLSGDKDSCYGDSGGPFQYQNRSKQYTIYGIVSFGLGCAKPNTLGVYVDVGYYLKWILSNLERK